MNMKVGELYMRWTGNLHKNDSPEGPVYEVTSVHVVSKVATLVAMTSITGDYTLHANTADFPDGWIKVSKEHADRVIRDQNRRAGLYKLLQTKGHIAAEAFLLGEIQ